MPILLSSFVIFTFSLLSTLYVPIDFRYSLVISQIGLPSSMLLTLAQPLTLYFEFGLISISLLNLRFYILLFIAFLGLIEYFIPLVLTISPPCCKYGSVLKILSATSSKIFLIVSPVIDLVYVFG